MSHIIHILLIAFALAVHQCRGDCVQAGIPLSTNLHYVDIVSAGSVYSCSLACQVSKDCNAWVFASGRDVCYLCQGHFDEVDQTRNFLGLQVAENCFCHLKEEKLLDNLYGTCVQYGRPSGFGLQPSGYFIARSVLECSDACMHAKTKAECSLWAFNQKNNKCTLMKSTGYYSGPRLVQEGFEHIVIGDNCFLARYEPLRDSIECVSESKANMEGPDEEAVGALQYFE